MEAQPPVPGLPLFLQTTLHLESVASTSTLVRQLLEAGRAPLPVLVTARHQTAGRGQRTNRWYADEGSLTFTLGLDLQQLGIKPEAAPRLALATAVAVVETLAPLAPAAALGIRWPNDVVAADRKLGGILPEWVDTTQGPRLALGVGLNLTTRLDQAPPEVRSLAVSLAELGARDIDLAALLDRLVHSIASTLHDLADRPATLARKWQALDTLRGEVVTIRASTGQTTTARVLGIDEGGGLSIAGANAPATLLAGQILRPSSESR